ncbi:MAG: tRNA pseudouridine(38-40) synthase TruA [Bacteroidales bacterium]|nr:tRNA pseudouridine(38-40) synthase TruA [Bacteroidales bacterium]
MHRYFLQLCFKGTNYHGWQVQPNATSVQKKVNDALTTILKKETEVTGAGRTDTGVHASFFIAHFDSETSFNELHSKLKFLNSLNAILPNDIAITDVCEVSPEAHARYSAVKRTYEYTIVFEKNPFLSDMSWYISRKPDIQQMNRCGELLLQYHDFTSFSRLHSDSKTNLCRIYEAYWTDSQAKMVFSITADRFLRNMVRAIVGTMIDVGKGKINHEDFKSIIEQKNRNAAGASAPAKGLVLTNLEYPVDIKNV